MSGWQHRPDPELWNNWPVPASRLRDQVTRADLAAGWDELALARQARGDHDGARRAGHAALTLRQVARRTPMARSRSGEGCENGQHFFVKGTDGRWHCTQCPAVQ